MSSKYDAVKILILSALVTILPVVVFARIGVGIGVGKIRVNEQLRAGGIYDLPTAIPVLNTGDEPANYQVSVQYYEKQETRSDMGFRPAEGWFVFMPQSFSLEPGKVQSVKVTLTLPTKVTPGNYYALLEAQPVKKSVAGEASIGVAAATQLWFTVAPANFLQGIYYRFISLYSRYQPWDTIVLVIIFILALLLYISKKFKFQIARK